MVFTIMHGLFSLKYYEQSQPGDEDKRKNTYM